MGEAVTWQFVARQEQHFARLPDLEVSLRNPHVLNPGLAAKHELTEI